MRRPALVVGSLLLAATVALTGCGSDSSSDGDGASKETKTLSFSVENGKVTPNGESVTVAVDQPIEITVTSSDQAGEMHVHSTPEHSFEFTAGEKQTMEKFSISKPGVVPIELHDPALQVFRLEVK